MAQIGSGGSVKNPLFSTQQLSSDALQVALHPLPILEISDYITRSYLRAHEGAIVGALLGQQNGREVTIEQSFSCRTEKTKEGVWELDMPLFLRKLDQMRLVYKDPALDLVGWYTLANRSGPTHIHLPIHTQILSYNESAILLGFHVDEILHPIAGNPLPITIYESNLEAPEEGEDMEMKDARDPAAPSQMMLKFRELPYSTETGEAEMIAVQFVRQGGATAARQEVSESANNGKMASPDTDTAKGSGKGKQKEENPSRAEKKTGRTPAGEVQAAPSKDANLSKDEADFMAALQAKSSAIRMMKSRVDLIVKYLEGLPPAFVAGKQSSAEARARQTTACPSTAATLPSNIILRQIQALVTNISLANPARQELLEREIRAETNNVQLVALISDLLGSVRSMREVGKKFAAVETARMAKQRQPMVEFPMIDVLGTPTSSAGGGNRHSGGAAGGLLLS